MLSSVRMPFGKDEAWTYANLREMFCSPFKPASNQAFAVSMEQLEDYIDSSCRHSCLVFVDGRFSPQLSSLSEVPKDVVVGSLAALDVVGAEEELLTVPDQTEELRDSFASDAISALNLANMVDAAYIEVPAGVKCPVPIQILFCSSAPSAEYSDFPATASYPRLHVRVREQASLSLKHSHVSLSRGPGGVSEALAPSLVCANSRVQVEKDASCVHTVVQELAVNTRHLEVLTADIRGNSSYTANVVLSGAKMSRLNAHLDLQESKANCSLSVASLAGVQQSQSIHSSITHSAPEANSRQQQRNVVADKGLAVFKGRIRVPKIAQLTDSDQLCRSLMLGAKARIVAMPTLEITADNVVCSHGASVADLDENSLFYLSSRGLDRLEARKLLLRSFVLDMVAGAIMDDPAIQRVVSKVESMQPSENFEEAIKIARAGGQDLFSI